MKPITQKTKHTIKFRLIKISSDMLRLVLWLGKIYFPANMASLSIPIKGYFRTMETILSTRGLDELIRINKIVRNQFTRYLFGMPNTPEEGVRLYKNSYPRVLKSLVEIMDKEDSTMRNSHIRLILTALSYTKIFSFKPKPNLTSITGPFTGDGEVFKDLEVFVSGFWKSLGMKKLKYLPESLEWKEFHFSSKAGPNGPAVLTALTDLFNLKDHTVLSEAIREVGGEKLSQTMDKALKVLNFLPQYLVMNKGLLRKLSAFSDKEGKTRVIAIMDYWSQTCLKPIHDYIFNILKRIPQDMTFNQSRFSEKVDVNTKFFSVDLTDATDRMPMRLINLVLKGRLPDGYVDAWERIMVHMPFNFGTGQYKYQVGNPMGAYSSWASFALVHHFLVYVSCLKAEQNYKTLLYFLLGDDIVIGSESVALHYLELLKRLGMVTSEKKTYISIGSFEFAKRIIFKGEEVSPFPLVGLYENRSRFYLILNVFREAFNKCWTNEKEIPDIIRLFYQEYMKFNSRRSKDIYIKSFITNINFSVLKGFITARGGIESIIRFCKSEGRVNDEIANSVYSLSTYKSLESSISAAGMINNSRYYTDNFDYLLQDPDFMSEVDGLEVVPLFFLDEESKRKLRKLGGDLLLQYTKSGSHLWPWIINTIAIPFGVNLFVARKQDMVMFHTSKLTKFILKTLKDKDLLQLKDSEISSLKFKFEKQSNLPYSPLTARLDLNPVAKVVNKSRRFSLDDDTITKLLDLP